MRSRFPKATAIVVAFFIGTMFAGVAWAATTIVQGNLTVNGTVKAKNFTYSSARTVLYNVPGAAFTADLNPVGHGDYSGSVVIPPSSDAVAPVMLPQGAIVTKVVVMTDVLTDGQIRTHLEASSFTGNHSDMVSFDSASPTVCASSPPCTSSTTAVSPNKVDNKKRTYGLWLRNEDGSNPVTVYRVAIYYKISAAGPASASALSGDVGQTTVRHNR